MSYSPAALGNTNCGSAQRDILADLKRQLEDHNREVTSATSRVRACKNALAAHERTVQDLVYQFQTAEDHHEALKEALEKDNAEDEINALQLTLKEVEAEKVLNEGSFKDSEAAMTEKMQTLLQLKREKHGKDAELATCKDKLQVAEDEKKLVQNKRRTVLDEKNAALALIEDDKQANAIVMQKHELVRGKVVEYHEKAGLVSSRVPVEEGETPRSLEAKLERLHRDLDRYTAQ